MSKKQHFNSFAKRMTRWLMLSLVVTLGIMAITTFRIALSAITSLENTRNLNVLDTHEFVADAEQSDDLTMLAIQYQ